MIETRLLRQFIVVAEELHFHRAAARLHMAQPALSQAIAKLEARLGFAALTRSRRSVALTPAGRAFLETAYATLDTLDAGIGRARRVADGVAGRLTIATLSLAGYTPVLETLRAFRRALPEVELDLREMPSARQLEALVAGEVDVALMRELALPAVIETRQVLTEAILLALPTDHPGAKSAASNEPVALGDFAESDFVFTPRALGPGYHHQLMALCQAAGFTPNIQQEAAQLTTLLGLVASGLGVALVPASIARSLRLDGVVFCALAPLPGRPDASLALNVNWHRENTSPLIEDFITRLKSQTRNETLPL
ncbi:MULTISPECIES: LysR family transcriptional regulator [unclassified Halomonas]|uniref:LysR family transcriptional regulator n=1 Tax=unclassified Halomonas TaxID=2609666 RepID=UPI00207694CC|nr:MULTISPECIES: LysR family transcriptional regulator [unclassified Halomonas]